MSENEYLVTLVSRDLKDAKQVEISFEFLSLESALHFMKLAITHNENITAEVRKFPLLTEKGE